MKAFTRFFVIVCLVTACFFVLPTASADAWNRKTVMTFTAPFEVPGVGAQVLPAGTYVFKILDSSSDRHIVQIFNKEENHVFTTILAIPNYRLQPTDKTVLTFKERGEGQPEAIRAWFYPGRQWGEEFVYSKPKALALAKVANEPILYTPTEVATIDDLRTAPVEAVKPTGEVVPVAEVVQAPPMEAPASEPTKTLPSTASYLPLLALAGLISLAGAGVVSKYSA
jgi:hypothetical protein